jgi:hypothetical protein
MITVRKQSSVYSIPNLTAAASMWQTSFMLAGCTAQYKWWVATNDYCGRAATRA